MQTAHTRPNKLLVAGIVLLLVVLQPVLGQQSASPPPKSQQELQEEIKLQKIVIDQQAEQLEEQKRLLGEIAKRLDQLEKKQSGPPTSGQVTMIPAVATSEANQPVTNRAAPEKLDQDNTKASKFLEEGVMPGSIKIPGTDISMKLGGYVKLDFIQDFDGIGNQSQFKTDTIPINGTPNADLGGLSTFQAIETRFNVDFRGDTERGKFRAFFEGDFYG